MSAPEIHPDLWHFFLSDFLRPSAPTLTSCYWRVANLARERGLKVPSESTFRRKLKREVPDRVTQLKREGEEALRRSILTASQLVDHARNSARQRFLGGAVMDAARAQHKIGRLIYHPCGLDPEEEQKLISESAVDLAEALRVICREIQANKQRLSGLPANRAEDLERVLTRFIVGGPQEC